jgi:hypothetical protein
MNKYILILAGLFLLHSQLALAGFFGKKDPVDERVEFYMKLARTAVKSRNMNQEQFKKTYEFWKILVNKKNLLTEGDLQQFKVFVDKLEKFPGGSSNKKRREEMKKAAVANYNQWMSPWVQDKSLISFDGLVNIMVTCKIGSLNITVGFIGMLGATGGFGKCIRTDFRAFWAAYPSGGIGGGAGVMVMGGKHVFTYQHDRFGFGLKAAGIKETIEEGAVGVGASLEKGDTQERGIGAGVSEMFKFGAIIRVSPKFFDFDYIREELNIPKISKSPPNKVESLEQAAKQFDPNIVGTERDMISQSEVFNPSVNDKREKLNPLTFKQVAQLYKQNPAEFQKKVQADAEAEENK